MKLLELLEKSPLIYTKVYQSSWPNHIYMEVKENGAPLKIYNPTEKVFSFDPYASDWEIVE